MTESPPTSINLERAAHKKLHTLVKKGNTKLLTQINDGLAKIKKDGEFAKIYHKWFGKQPPKALLHD